MFCINFWQVFFSYYYIYTVQNRGHNFTLNIHSAMRYADLRRKQKCYIGCYFFTIINGVFWEILDHVSKQ